jgi:hypothetical protein
MEYRVREMPVAKQTSSWRRAAASLRNFQSRIWFCSLTAPMSPKDAVPSIIKANGTSLFGVSEEFEEFQFPE